MLYVSSPSLYREYKRWENGELSEKKIEKLCSSLYKYRLRMSLRSTPFGLMSKVDSKRISELEKGIINNGKRRVSRLDNTIIQQLIEKIECIEELIPFLNYKTNSSIYKANGSYRYYFQVQENGTPKREIKSITSDPIIERLIEYCQEFKTGRSIDMLLKKYSDVPAERLNFLKQLLDQQILHSNLGICLSEDDQLGRIIRILQEIKLSYSRLGHLNHILSNLVRLQLRLIRLDKGERKRISAYKALRKQLINMGIEIHGDNFIQVNQFGKSIPAKKEKQFSFPNSQEVSKLIEYLSMLKDHKPSLRMQGFIERFKRRYGECSEGILEVMDPELGLGYGISNSNQQNDSALLKEIPFQAKNPIRTGIEIQLPKETTSILSDAIQSNSREVDLYKIGEVTKGQESMKALPASFSMLIKVVELEENKKAFLLKDIGGAHANHYIGRFASSSKEIEDLANDIAKHESEIAINKEVVECFHGSNHRAANINGRPLLYGNSLHLFDNPNNSRKALKLEDIRIQMKEDTLTLVSRSRMKEIIPRISSALNHKINTWPLHHFLGDFQYQKCNSELNFSWGNWEDHFCHFPRLRYGRFILKPEQWRFRSSLLLKKLDEIGLAEWKRRSQLPELCQFVHGDQELLINFESALGIDLFKTILEKHESILIQEYLRPAKGLITDCSGNDYEHELIFSILNKEEFHSPTYRPLNGLNKEGLGNSTYREQSWIYFKAYCNQLNSDRALRGIHPIIECLRRKGVIKDWFFIRYSDPDHHLRIRLKLEKIDEYGAVAQLLADKFKVLEEQKLIWKFQLDKYQAEVNRYGSKSIGICESLFHMDSDCILRLINSIKRSQIEIYRWQFGVLLIDDWLDSFSLSINQRKQLLESWCKGLKSEFNFNKDTKTGLAKQWRAKRTYINQLLSRNDLRDINAKLLSAIVAERSLKMDKYITCLRELDKRHALEVAPFSLLNSLCHMSCNRLFPYAARAHELVVYDLLWNYYRSIERKRVLSRQEG